MPRRTRQSNDAKKAGIAVDRLIMATAFDFSPPKHSGSLRITSICHGHIIVQWCPPVFTCNAGEERGLRNPSPSGPHLSGNLASYKERPSAAQQGTRWPSSSRVLNFSSKRRAGPPGALLAPINSPNEICRQSQNTKAKAAAARHHVGATTEVIGGTILIFKYWQVWNACARKGGA